MKEPTSNQLFESIRELIQTSRRQVVRQVNSAMVKTYFEIGRQIVENEQGGKERAGYAKEVLKTLSGKLQNEFGKGFSVQNLQNMRLVYLEYSKYQTLSVIFEKELSWSHFIFLSRIENKDERNFYEIEAAENQWSLRELKRQFDTGLYERLALSKKKKEVKKLSQKGQIIERPADAIKDPYILEFLNLDEKTKYSEADLESAIIDKLQEFLLELGKGFTFVARQKRLTFSEKHFYIDLVFYNRILQSFVLIDLKIGELNHKDLGQMQMYVNYYDREMRLPSEQKTIGVVLCKLKDKAVVEYTLPEDNQQIFASQYLTVLPDKEQLKNLLNQKIQQ